MHGNRDSSNYPACAQRKFLDPTDFHNPLRSAVLAVRRELLSSKALLDVKPSCIAKTIFTQSYCRRTQVKPCAYTSSRIPCKIR